ncbi:hypothetical protein FCV25MIE_28506 [Fagus crenata]
MASSPLNQKSNYHARSISLPSKPHPLIVQCKEHLCKLGTSDASSSTSSSLGNKLSCLQDLHECVEKLLQLPLTQQAIVQEHNNTWVEELLDGSLRLLDVCSAAKDALIHTKECARELQSIIRRRRGGEMELEREVKKYLMSRKVVKKAVQKALKGIERNRPKVAITIKQLVLGVQVGPPKRVACENEETERSELEKVDAALYSITGQTTCKSDYSLHVENVQNTLGQLEPIVQDLEEALECLFRRLIKTRVSLLNIFNH